MKINLREQAAAYRHPDTTKLSLIPVGTTVGFWTVIETGLHIKSGKKNPRACRVRCRCGREKLQTSGRLRHGDSLSCGCRRSIVNMERTVLIPVGMQFGFWTVIETGLHKGYATQTHRACRVRCICGTIRVLVYGRLNKSSSCGCKNKIRNMDTIWKTIYRCASRRGWDFALSFSEFKVISQLSCSYCGIEPSNFQAGRYKVDGKEKMGADPSMAVRYSGIDRIDSTKAYVHGNVLPCCYDCNRAKSALPLDVFLAWVARIQKHNPSVDGVLHRAATLF